MANDGKPVGKTMFSSSASSASPQAPDATGRAALPGRAVAAVDLPTVRIGRSPTPTATGIAHSLGWLAREAALDGTPLTVGGLPWDGAPPRATPSAAAPTVHLREGDSTTALWERSTGHATRLVGLTWVDGLQAVVTRPDTGIRGPEQLAGRRLALPRDRQAPIDVRRAAACRGLDAALSLAGIFPGEVARVDIDSPAGEPPYQAELAALACGDVDAVFVAGAAGAAAAAQAGAVTVVDVGRHLDPAVRTGPTTPATITVDATLLDREPNLVVRLLAVLLRAGAWAQLETETATRLVAHEVGTTARHVTAAYGPGWQSRLGVDLGHGKLDALRAQHDYLVTHGFITQPIDFGAWVDPRPLGAARELLAAERTAWV